MPTAIRKARIVWVEIPDPRGRNVKRRPAVVLTPTEEIRHDGVVQVAAITTLVGAAPGVAVPLPWHRDGHPRTGLRRPSEVVCDWLNEVPVAGVEVTDGLVPLKEMSQIDAIVRRVKTKVVDPPAESAPPPDVPPT